MVNDWSMHLCGTTLSLPLTAHHTCIEKKLVFNLEVPIELQSNRDSITISHHMHSLMLGTTYGQHSFYNQTALVE